MRIVVLSDAHVDGPQDPVQRQLLAFLYGLRADRLVLLGDIFQRWWSLGGNPFPAYLPVVQALRRLARRGIAADFVVGNHDFAMPPGALGMPVRQALVVVADGQALHFCHGDRADPSAQSRLTRAVLRSAAFERGLRLAGRTRAWRLLGRLAGAPDRAGEPSERLLRAQRHHARALLERGADLVVMAHSHRGEILRWPTGGYANSGSFRDRGQHLVLEEGVPRLERFPG